jgi:hypothetical protein
MKKPKTQRQYILKKLIENKSGISERQTNFNMFRGSISVLKKMLQNSGINLTHIDRPFINQFGRKRNYRTHILLRKDVRAAKKIYNQN